MIKKNIISLDNIKEMSGGDNKFIIEIIDIFLSNSCETINDLEVALKENDFENIKKKAHKFKTTAYIFGINELLNILILMEKDGMCKVSINERNETLKKIKTITQRACVQLRVEREKYI